MPRRPIRSSPSQEERRNIAEFFAAAAAHWGGQLKLEELTGLRQPTINGIINRRASAGGRSLFALSHLTGIPIEDIRSGAGTLMLRARKQDAAKEMAQLNRLRASRALAELFDVPLVEIQSLFDEIGLELPVEIPATAWFDVGRAALERRAVGLALTRRVGEIEP